MFVSDTFTKTNSDCDGVYCSTIRPDLSGNCQDSSKPAVTVTFDPPIPPGRQITIALNATNSRDGIYIYEVAAMPPETTGLGQRIGIERLNFYQRLERRYF